MADVMRNCIGLAVGLVLVGLVGAGCRVTPATVSVEVVRAPGMIQIAEIAKSYVNISPDEVKRKIDAREDFTLIDLRPTAQYEAGHLPGALSIPGGTFAATIDCPCLSREKETVVYCQTGLNSPRAAGLLVAAGFTKVKNMVGGIAAWPYEVVTGNAITVSL